MIEVTIKETTYDIPYVREEMDDLIYNQDQELFYLYMKLQNRVKHVTDKKGRYIIYRHLDRLRDMLNNSDYIS